MTVSQQVVRIQKNNSGTNGATQDINLNFTPKGAIFMSEGNNVDNTFSDQYLLSYGYSNGSNNRCMCGASEGPNASSDSRQSIRNDSCIAFLSLVSDTLLSSATATFTTNKITLTWDLNDTTNPYIIVIAFGGSDITNVAVNDGVTGRTSTGTTDYTNVGFTPTEDNSIVLMAGAANTTFNSVNVGSSVAVGAGTIHAGPTVKNVNVGNASEDGRPTMDTWRIQRGDYILIPLVGSSGSIAHGAKLDAYITNGFRLNYAVAPLSSSYIIIYMVIKGGRWDIGSQLSRTTTGVQNVTVSANSKALKGLMTMSIGSTTENLPSQASYAIMGLGVSDGTNEGAIDLFDEDAVADSNCRRRNSGNNRCLTSGDPDVGFNANFNGFSTNQFSLDYDVVDSNARYYFWIILANELELVQVVKTLTLKYNINQKIVKTNTLKYNINQKVTKSLTLRYNILNRIIDILTLRYNIRQKIVKTNTLRYNIRQKIIKIATLRYNITIPVEKTLTIRYNILERITKPLTLRYDIRQKIVKSLTLRYNILNTLVKILTLRYNITKSVVKSLTLRYNILQKIVKTNTIRYNIRQKIIKTNTLRYNILNTVTKELTLRYNILNEITKILTIRYNILQKIVKTNTIRYNINQKIVKINTIRYNINQKIVKSLTLRYNILEKIVKSLTLRYNILQKIVKELTIRYNIREKIVKIVTLRYNIRQKIIKTLTIIYDIVGSGGLQRVTKILTLRYNIQEKKTKQVTLRYNIMNNVVKNVTIRYNILNIVVKPLTLKYNIRQKIVKTVSLRYNILNTILKVVTFRYNITKSVEKMLTIRYNIRQKITKGLILKYNIRQKIIKSLTIKYHIGDVIFVRVVKTLTLRYRILGKDHVDSDFAVQQQKQKDNFGQKDLSWNLADHKSKFSWSRKKGWKIDKA